MIEKTCVVTGATGGIGYITARELVRQGARVGLVGRDPGRCQAAVARIQAETGQNRAEAFVADLSRPQEVRRLAGLIQKAYPRLDVLVNNVGAMFAERELTAEGFERTFALNHLAPFLLTKLLLDRLSASMPARVVNVASDAHRMGRIDFENLQGERSYRGFSAYCQSKLANVLFTNELALRLKGTGVTANSLHPGFVNSQFFAGKGFSFWLMRRFAGVVAISPEQGARTSIYLASSLDVESTSGRYFVKCQPAKPAPRTRDEETGRELWNISEELLRLH